MADDVIPLARPDVGPREIDAVCDVLRSDRLSLGPRMIAFEQAVAERANRRFGIAVNSGTSGLHLCVKALGLGEGDEVITTPFSFVASTNCLLFERVRPVFVDIDPASYNLDPDALESAITPQTRGILAVEVFGHTAHFDRYEQIARKHGLALIEDCCEALGATLAERPAGSFGDCGVFAFYPNKQITTGEGGLIVTDREDLRDLCVSLRNQGRDSAAWLQHARLGYNYRMDEMSAALGAVQVNRLNEILAARRAVAGLYREVLSGIEEIHLPPTPGGDPERASWFVYVIRLADTFSAEHRRAVMDHLQGQGVQCNAYFPPIHLQPYMREMLGHRPGDFPLCEALADRTIALPFFAGLQPEQALRVADTIRDAIARMR